MRLSRGQGGEASSYVNNLRKYIFIEKVDNNHVCCRREGAKETSAPEKGVVRA